MSENETPTNAPATPEPEHNHRGPSAWSSFKTAMKQFRMTATDLVRLIICVLLMLIFFYPDWTNFHIVSVVTGFFVAISAISHIARRLLLPYFDMNTAIKTATSTSMGAAIVVAAIVYLLSVMLTVGGSFFR